MRQWPRVLLWLLLVVELEVLVAELVMMLLLAQRPLQRPPQRPMLWQRSCPRRRRRRCFRLRCRR